MWSCGIRILAAALLAVCEGMGEDDEHNDDYDGDHGDYDGDVDDADEICQATRIEASCRLGRKAEQRA